MRVPHAGRRRRGDVHGADGLVVAPAVRPGDPGDREPALGPERPGAVGHRQGGLTAHSPAGGENPLGHSEQSLFELVRIRDDPAHVARTRAGHGGDLGADHPAGTGLRGGQSPPPLRQQRKDDACQRVAAAPVKVPPRHGGKGRLHLGES